LGISDAVNVGAKPALHHICLKKVPETVVNHPTAIWHLISLPECAGLIFLIK
jgi:hypothetical protein